MPITVKELPKVIQAMMKDNKWATVAEVKYFESEEVTDSEGSPSSCRLRNSKEFTNYTIEKTLAEFEVFTQLDSDQKYLVMHMLGRYRNDIEADVRHQMGEAPALAIKAKLGMLGWMSNAAGCVEDVKKIATTHMKPLMVAVIGHLERKGLPKLQVAKTAKKDVKNLIEDWNIAAENRLAEGKVQEGKAQSEGLSGFSSLSKKALMALFKASLGLKPNAEAIKLIKEYATIEQNNLVSARQISRQQLGSDTKEHGGGEKKEKRTPPTSASQQPSGSKKHGGGGEKKAVRNSQQHPVNYHKDSGVNFTGVDPVGFSNLHGGACAKEQKEASKSLNKYIEKRESIERKQYGLGFGGFDKQVKIAAAQALQSVIANGHGKLTPEHIRALTQESFRKKDLARCVSGFMSPDAYKDFRKLRGKKEKLIDIACTIVDGKIVLKPGVLTPVAGSKIPELKAEKAGAPTPTPTPAAGAPPAGLTAGAKAPERPQKAAKEAEKLQARPEISATERSQEAAKSQARPEAFRARRCNPCEKVTNCAAKAAYAVWAIGAGAAAAAVNAVQDPVKAVANQFIFEVQRSIYQETIGLATPTTPVNIEKYTTPKPS